MDNLTPLVATFADLPIARQAGMLGALLLGASVLGAALPSPAARRRARRWFGGWRGSPAPRRMTPAR
ncbi:hypothetical protein [Rubellimicrobium sp. CFH 75288]|uniref:hypothetical protein n=1 Tax=Rubellimicrobium sp. CFH 75288 TaxID=2697034 RepID=UPI0014124A8F|nr:hypothetical protein [Rubellimicrobium sp. CFH 75288]NAZ35537.1 hypothetical protein [Rubellimicrobium sp. CFH 75288]